MNSPVFNALVPVILFIAMGFFVGRWGWIRAASVKDLSNLVFMVLAPALLFRTMSTVHVQNLDFGPIAIYFAAAGAGARAQVAAHGGHGHGVGFGHLRADGFLEPLVKLLQRVGTRATAVG